jgi:outer membrane receptor protein involved in Fe transport
MKQARTNTLHRSIVGILRAGALAAALALCVSGTAIAQASDPATFDIPQQPLPAALKAFAEQSGMQLLYRPETLHGATVRALNGKLDKRQALQMLLEGSGLEAVYSTENAATIRPRSRESSSKEGYTGGASATEAGPPAAGEAAIDLSSSATDPDNDEQVKSLEAVTVTGTRIRGGSTPSPVITIGSERIQEEGFADLGEVIRSVPQNFSGGQNPGVGSGASQGDPSSQNITGGSGMNLRGLGPDATLTLLNGHRMSYGGFSQSIDISTIPISALECIEIVPDGASAIYGSDAVGGVANVILKRDFDGVAVGARYGGATDGGLLTREYNATTGTTWATGGLIVAGTKTSNDPIYSDQRDYTKPMYRPSTLWQGSDVRSGLLSLHQALGNRAELRLDALGSQRNMHQAMAYPGVHYPYDVKTRNTLLAPSLEVWLPRDWTLVLSGAVGKERNSVIQPTVNSADGAVTSDGLGEYRNESRVYEIGAEGPLFALPGGEARLAAGTGYRYNDMLYLSGGSIFAGGDESSRFAYAELSLPLVGPEQEVGGVDRLALTGAVRTEDGGYGRVTTPKFGVIYSPSADFSLKASWGKSFKAPTLVQRHSIRTALYYPASSFGAGYPADATALWLSGGNPGLGPERARTWSASLGFHPEAVDGLEAELTWFDIDYTERVRVPVTTTDIFGNPLYVDFVHYGPTDAALTAAIESADNFYNLVGAAYDASKVVAIVDGGLYINAARQRIKGVDLSGSYRFDLGAGQLTLRGAASWLDSTQALTAAQAPYDMAGTLYFPAKVNGRIGAVWKDGGFTASLFGNYRSGVIDTYHDEKGSSFTTFDTTLRYDTGAREDAWSDLAVELSAQNVLNRAPPLYIPVSWTDEPFDSTNYSAVGRFVSLSVSKRW